jgi:phenylacetate-CoA ligase
MMKSVARLLYRAQESLLKRPTFALWRSLEKSQWLSHGEIEALQEKRLNALLATALEHSPWHAQRIREAGMEEMVRSQAVTLADLRRLPLMDKRDARENVDTLVWHEAPGGVYKYTTGGSSGEPLIFYFGRERQAADAANRMRAHRWWGVEPGEKELYLWGAPVELNKTDRIKKLRDTLLNQRLLNAFEMSPARMDDYCRFIGAWRPACIFGYASSLALLAAHAEARRYRFTQPGLKVVFATGEPLYPHQRELIERVFGVPVAVEYGCRDGGYLAHQAPGGQLLQMSETVIIEMLDGEGKPVGPGEAGEVVITNLATAAQPFIRYRTGDQARVGTMPDRGGRGLHVLDEVLGRQTDFVVREDGTLMHALSLIYVLRATEGVARFKCIQHTPLDLEVQVVPDSRWNDLARQKVIDGLRARMGENLRVDLRLVDVIPAEVSGKYRYVVSHVDLDGELRQASGQYPASSAF